MAGQYGEEGSTPLAMDQWGSPLYQGDRATFLLDGAIRGGIITREEGDFLVLVDGDGEVYLAKPEALALDDPV